MGCTLSKRKQQIDSLFYKENTMSNSLSNSIRISSESDSHALAKQKESLGNDVVSPTQSSDLEIQHNDKEALNKDADPSSNGVSKKATKARDKAHRRLSTNPIGGIVHVDIQDDNQERGLIRNLQTRKSMAELSPLLSGKRRWSVGTETDKDMSKRESYCDKSTKFLGQKFILADRGIGYACKKGLKPVSPNQDSFMIVRIEGGASIYGVFDGHGRSGHDISNIVKDKLTCALLQHECFYTDTAQALKDAFSDTHDYLVKESASGAIDATTSGTTATVVVDLGHSIYVAHVGDSRCVLLCRDGEAVRLQSSSNSAGHGLTSLLRRHSHKSEKSENDSENAGQVSSVELTMDHKPQLPLEKERILKSGGIVLKPPADVNHRVYVRGQRYPGLAMSRALGDLIGHFEAGISPIPDVKVMKLPFSKKARSEDETEPDQDESDSSDETLSLNGKFPEKIVLCSDGVWEFVSNDEACQLVSKFPKGKEMHAAEELAKLSWDRWIQEEHGFVVDDISVVIATLSSSPSLTAPPSAQASPTAENIFARLKRLEGNNSPTVANRAAAMDDVLGA